jgi:prepilin-type processing-associated H-X9-DG protein
LPDKHTSAELWNKDTDPRVAIGADGNNGKQPDHSQNGTIPDNNGLKTYVNSENHTGDGQNVLYGDGHCSWSNTAYVGLEDDNIYTALSPDYRGKAGTSSGVLSARPRDSQDTVLIPNRDEDLANWNRKP